MKRTTNLLKRIIVSTLVLVIALTSLNLIAMNNEAEAATVYDTDVKAPGTGNVFVAIDGTYSTASEKDIINRINAIRLEACNQGVINPETGKRLTQADYKPVVWSNALETYARLRAAEASVNWAHTRPSNKSTFKNTVKITNGYHSSENLALGYTIMKSIEGYYSEKDIYVNNKSGVTGHYTNMISPSNTLIGVAGFQQKNGSIFSAMEFGTLFSAKDTNDHTRKGLTGSATQLVEVNVALLVNSITLSGTNSIVVGKTIRLSATANMKNATKTASIIKGLTWKSSNNGIATVDANGNVKGVKAGTATITASCGGKSATFKITVKNAVRVTNVKLNITNKTIVKGTSFKLAATVYPSNASNKSVTWKSSNMNVATVDSKGNVRGLRAGTAVITVTTKDGSKKAICRVTVTNPVAVKSVALNAKTATVNVNKTYQLKATLNPTNATNKNVTWKSSNTKVATVDANGKVTAKAAGTVTITVTTKDGNKTATCKITVKK